MINLSETNPASNQDREVDLGNLSESELHSKLEELDESLRTYESNPSLNNQESDLKAAYSNTLRDRDQVASRLGVGPHILPNIIQGEK